MLWPAMTECLKEFRVKEDTTSGGTEFQSPIVLGKKRVCKRALASLLFFKIRQHVFIFPVESLSVTTKV